MSCNHFEETSAHIRKIVEELYPEIHYRFVLIGSYSNFENENCKNLSVSELLILVNELKSVFHALATYETRLVFPSVLKYFENNGAEVKGQLPDIAVLLSMTRSKEKQLLKLCNEIDTRLKNIDADMFPQKENIAFISSFFQNEFKNGKEKWNEILKDRIQNCACFRIIRLYNEKTGPDNNFPKL